MDRPDRIPEKNPFKVPENYFEEVNRKILSSTTGEKTSSGKSVYVRMKPFIAAAAAVAVLVTAAYFSVQLFSPGNRSSDFSSLNIPADTEFLLDELDISTIENDSTLTGMIMETPDISNSEIINSLIEENIDINEIYERL